MTGTFDNWSKSEKMSKVGDVFEKSVALPDSSAKIYYKVGALHLLCWFRFIYTRLRLSAAAPGGELMRLPPLCIESAMCEGMSAREQWTMGGDGPNSRLCGSAAANALLLSATRTTPRESTSTNDLRALPRLQLTSVA